jgi:hypothetical protein
MIRYFKHKSLYILAGLLLLQPAAQAFSFEQAKTMLIQNFEAVKPYFTTEKIIATSFICGILGYFGYVLYSSKKKSSPKRKNGFRNNEKEELKKEDKENLLLTIQTIQQNVIKKTKITAEIVRDIGEIFRSINQYDNLVSLSSAITQLFSAIKDYNAALKEKESKELDSTILHINNTCEQIQNLARGKTVDHFAITDSEETTRSNGYVESNDNNAEEDNNDPIIGKEELKKKIKRIQIIANLKRDEISQQDMKSIRSTIKPLKHCTLNEEVARLFSAIEEYNKAIKELPLSSEKEKVEANMTKAVNTIRGACEYMLNLVPIVIQK